MTVWLRVLQPNRQHFAYTACALHAWSLSLCNHCNGSATDHKFLSHAIQARQWFVVCLYCLRAGLKHLLIEHLFLCIQCAVNISSCRKRIAYCVTCNEWAHVPTMSIDVGLLGHIPKEDCLQLDQRISAVSLPLERSALLEWHGAIEKRAC